MSDLHITSDNYDGPSGPGLYGQWSVENGGSDFRSGGRWTGLHVRNTDGTFQQVSIVGFLRATGKADRRAIREYAARRLGRKAIVTFEHGV